MSIMPLGIDVNGNVVYSLPFPNEKLPIESQGACTHLTPVSERIVTIPPGMRRIWMSYSTGSTVYVKKNQTTGIPVAPTFTPSVIEINPAVREVNPGDTVHFISEDNATVCVRFDQVERVPR